MTNQKHGGLRKAAIVVALLLSSVGTGCSVQRREQEGDNADVVEHSGSRDSLTDSVSARVQEGSGDTVTDAAARIFVEEFQRARTRAIGRVKTEVPSAVDASGYVTAGLALFIDSLPFVECFTARTVLVGMFRNANNGAVCTKNKPQ